MKTDSLDDRPLGPAFHALSLPLQAIVRRTRDAEHKVRTRAKTAIDVLDIMTPWLVEVEMLGTDDRTVLKELGIVLADLEHAVHHFDPERSPPAAQALLRSFDERILGYDGGDPMRRGGGV